MHLILPSARRQSLFDRDCGDLKWLFLLLVLFLPAQPACATSASAVKWYSYSGTASPQPASFFSTAAPNVYDGSVSDTTTGYTATGNVCVLWDMGAAVTLTAVRAQYTGATGATAYVSSDGTTWNTAASLTSGSQSNFTATVRYLEVVVPVARK